MKVFTPETTAAPFCQQLQVKDHAQGATISFLGQMGIVTSPRLSDCQLNITLSILDWVDEEFRAGDEKNRPDRLCRVILTYLMPHPEVMAALTEAQRLCSQFGCIKLEVGLLQDGIYTVVIDSPAAPVKISYEVFRTPVFMAN